ATDSGVYVLAHARGENYLYRVEPDGSARAVAQRIGAAPAYGTAAPPAGTILVAAWSGRIHRVAPAGAVHPCIQVGHKIYQIAAGDAGAVFGASDEGEVLRIAPDGRGRALSTPFGRGRLVAVAATPEGNAYAAERGDNGRSLRIGKDGLHEVIARV